MVNQSVASRRGDIQHRVIEVMNGFRSPDVTRSVTLEDAIIDVVNDSMDWVEACMDLEQQFKVTLEIGDYYEKRRPIRDIVDAIMQANA